MASVAIAVVGIGSVAVAVESEDTTGFDQIEQRLENLNDTEKFVEALALLDSVTGNYPLYEFEITNWRARLYLNSHQYERAMAVWSAGHDRGFFYLLHPRLPIYKEVAQLERFAALYSVDSAFRAQALKESKSISEVVLPEGYDAAKEYPLLIALHGGGSTIERARRHWIPGAWQPDIIVMLVQSYRHYDLKHFGWRPGDERTYREMRDIFDKARAEYSIDTSQVLIGGVSAGGSMAIDIALKQIVPVIGVVGVCPGKPASLTDSAAVALGRTGFRAFMVAGETDYYRARQDSMMVVFDAADLEYDFHEIPDLGHNYPPDFSTWLDRALDYILGQN